MLIDFFFTMKFTGIRIDVIGIVSLGRISFLLNYRERKKYMYELKKLSKALYHMIINMDILWSRMCN